MLRLGNIARLELNYCVPMGVQSGDRYDFTGRRTATGRTSGGKNGASLFFNFIKIHQS